MKSPWFGQSRLHKAPAGNGTRYAARLRGHQAFVAYVILLVYSKLRSVGDTANQVSLLTYNGPRMVKCIHSE